MVPTNKRLVTIGAFKGLLSHVILIHVSDQIRVPVKLFATDTASLCVLLGFFLLHKNNVNATLTTRQSAVDPIPFIIQCHSYATESCEPLAVSLSSRF